VPSVHELVGIGVDEKDYEEVLESLFPLSKVSSSGYLCVRSSLPHRSSLEITGFCIIDVDLCHPFEFV